MGGDDGRGDDRVAHRVEPSQAPAPEWVGRGARPRISEREPGGAPGEPGVPLRPRRAEPSAEEHRDQVVAELRASGPDRRSLEEHASKVGAGWAAKLAKLGVAVELGRFECHEKGCFVTVVHRSADDVDRAMQVITRTGEFHGWQSGKMRTGVVPRSDGKAEVTWVLYPPQPGQLALAATLPEDNLDELEVAVGP
jgi:hypothetical protein